jgi:folate-binding Fe-S cluster repair protein YgfZ
MSVVPDRALVRMSGPDAVAHLQSMVSNDVEAIPAGGGAYALLLTPKARVISDLEVFNTGAGLVLACPPETRNVVVDVLVRARFR